MDASGFAGCGGRLPIRSCALSNIFVGGIAMYRPFSSLDGRDEGAVHLKAVGFVIEWIVVDNHREALDYRSRCAVAAFRPRWIAGFGVDNSPHA